MFHSKQGSFLLLIDVCRTNHICTFNSVYLLLKRFITRRFDEVKFVSNAWKELVLNAGYEQEKVYSSTGSNLVWQLIESIPKGTKAVIHSKLQKLKNMLDNHKCKTLYRNELESSIREKDSV